MRGCCTHAVVLLMSWTLCSGSVVSGQRRTQGAKTMARALADILFVSSCSAILKHTRKKGGVNPDVGPYRVNTRSHPAEHTGATACDRNGKSSMRKTENPTPPSQIQNSARRQKYEAHLITKPFPLDGSCCSKAAQPLLFIISSHT